MQLRSGRMRLRQLHRPEERVCDDWRLGGRLNAADVVVAVNQDMAQSYVSMTAYCNDVTVHALRLRRVLRWASKLLQRRRARPQCGGLVTVPRSSK